MEVSADLAAAPAAAVLDADSKMFEEITGSRILILRFSVLFVMSPAHVYASCDGYT